MSEVQQTYVELFKFANERIKTSASWEKALPWLVGSGALAAGTPLAYHLGKKKAIEEEKDARPWTFGAGALAGLVAPSILKQLKSTAGLKLGPGSMDPYDYGEFSEF